MKFLGCFIDTITKCLNLIGKSAPPPAPNLFLFTFGKSLWIPLYFTFWFTLPWMRNSWLFLSPFKYVFFWVKLGANERVVFSFNSWEILQVMSVIIVRQRVPKLIHPISKENIRRIWMISPLPGKVSGCHTVIVKVNCYFLLSNLSDNIRRSLTKIINNTRLTPIVSKPIILLLLLLFFYTRNLHIPFGQ